MMNLHLSRWWHHEDWTMHPHFTFSIPNIWYMYIYFLGHLKKWKTKLVQIEKGENQCFMQKANQLTLQSKPNSSHKKCFKNIFGDSRVCITIIPTTLWPEPFENPVQRIPFDTYDCFLQFSKFFSNSLCAQCDVSEVKNSFIGKNLGKKWRNPLFHIIFLSCFHTSTLLCGREGSCTHRKVGHFFILTLQKENVIFLFGKERKIDCQHCAQLKCLWEKLLRHTNQI